MSDPLRTDGPRISTAPEADHDAKIEQLLLAGLDQYFAGRYDDAINIWTRVLFLDRGHARARAYIDRARGALAERQRQSEELLQNGLAAFKRGDGPEARRLVRAAIDGGAPTDEALTVLDRLDRLEASLLPSRSAVSSAPGGDPPLPARRRPWGVVTFGASVALLVAAAAAYSASVWGLTGWPGALQRAEDISRAGGTPPARRYVLPLPRRGELALTRARSLAADGHLHDALAALDRVRPTDPEKVEADRLRGEIQLQLIALTSVPAGPTSADGASEPERRSR
jgi:tetratricopeptide (TPR) repeat protein